MIRDPGTYVVREGVSLPVVWRDRGWVALATFSGSPTDQLIPVRQLERLERVTLHATWSGVEVEVQRILPNRLAWLLVRDADLARNLGLYGDARRGWGVTAPVFALGDLAERVVRLA